MEKNVFTTRSFWYPIISALVSYFGLKLQPMLELSPDEVTAMTGIVVTIVIAVVRSVTTEPASFKGQIK